MRAIQLLAFLVLPNLSVVAAKPAAFESDPESSTLQALAEPLDVDESKYGCGPLLGPGKRYYVSLDGDDGGDGLSWATAWRHVHVALGKLNAGDTLIIGEGEYIEPHMTISQSGEPGRPITVMAAARHRVIISAAVRPTLQRTPNTSFTWQTTHELDDGRAMVWEADTKILLQPVAGIDMADELPGTWWYDEKQERIYIHFADSRTTEPHALAVRPGRVSISHFRNRDAYLWTCGAATFTSRACVSSTTTFVWSSRAVPSKARAARTPIAAAITSRLRTVRLARHASPGSSYMQERDGT